MLNVVENNGRPRDKRFEMYRGNGSNASQTSRPPASPPSSFEDRYRAQLQNDRINLTLGQADTPPSYFEQRFLIAQSASPNPSVRINHEYRPSSRFGSLIEEQIYNSATANPDPMTESSETSYPPDVQHDLEQACTLIDRKQTSPK